MESSLACTLNKSANLYLMYFFRVSVRLSRDNYLQSCKVTKTKLYSVNEILLTHLFPVHPFSIPWKHQEKIEVRTLGKFREDRCMVDHINTSEIKKRGMMSECSNQCSIFYEIDLQSILQTLTVDFYRLYFCNPFFVLVLCSWYVYNAFFVVLIRTQFPACMLLVQSMPFPPDPPFFNSSAPNSDNGYITAFTLGDLEYIKLDLCQNYILFMTFVFCIQ